MPRFLVTRQERWDQMVFIDALTEEDAKRRVAKGLGVISSDPEFVDYIYKENWNAERLEGEVEVEDESEETPPAG